jgi:hypothetical protein
MTDLIFWICALIHSDPWQCVKDVPVTAPYVTTAAPEVERVPDNG